MGDAPLDVVLLWHMHQPCYKRPQTGRMAMPWVRLHGVKDYLDMVLLTEEFPKIHLNINWVPSLLDQILEYASGQTDDEEWLLSRARPEEMDEAGRIALLKSHFAANQRRMIEPFPRYAELLKLRGAPGSELSWRIAAQRFTPGDLRDLQVWMNLTWIDPLLRSRDPFLEALVEKGRDFSDDDKIELFQRQRDILGQIIPASAQAWSEGRIEVSATPYYHPILPLLYDTDFARRARPDMLLPNRRFQRPEDARAQILTGVDRVEALMGRRPVGMWPSEGSVCDEIIPFFKEAGIRWIATDEEVLAQSLGANGFARDRFGNIMEPDRLYRAWRREYDASEVSLVFRDHSASDLIGFQFSDWPPEAAAMALISRLEEAQRRLEKVPGRHVVSIILDGENCWEFYDRDGIPFLRAFYERLSENPALRSVTVSEHLESAEPVNLLPKLHSGSWINHDFRVWIGHPEDNMAWDLLGDARDAYERRLESGPALSLEKREAARDSLWVAEGSDWNWWYGDDHCSGNDEMFDSLFRSRLKHVYDSLDLAPPRRLDQPILTSKNEGALSLPRGFLSPTIDGRATSYFEWFDAGYSQSRGGGGAMHQAGESLVERLYFGFDETRLFLRMDLADRRRWSDADGAKAAFLIFAAETWKIEVAGHGESIRATLRREDPGSGWLEAGAVDQAAADTIVEAAISFERLGLKPKDTFGLQVELALGDGSRERQPPQTPVSLSAPDADFEAKMWVV